MIFNFVYMHLYTVYDNITLFVCVCVCVGGGGMSKRDLKKETCLFATVSNKISKQSRKIHTSSGLLSTQETKAGFRVTLRIMHTSNLV